MGEVKYLGIFKSKAKHYNMRREFVPSSCSGPQLLQFFGMATKRVEADENRCCTMNDLEITLVLTIRLRLPVKPEDKIQFKYKIKFPSR